MKVKVRRGSAAFELKVLGIRDGIMKLQSTAKTRAYGVPEYLQEGFRGHYITIYRSNGWVVEVVA